MMSEPTGYTETMGRLNDPDNWDVAGMLADIAKNLRDESDNGRAIAAIDFLRSQMLAIAKLISFQHATKIDFMTIGEAATIAGTIAGKGDQ